MIPDEVLLGLSMFLALALGLSTLIIFVPDVIKLLSSDAGKEGAHGHKWSRALLPFATGTILFTGITIVGVLTG